jgi:hypothetical protein
MSFAALLTHSLTVVRTPRDDGDPDDYGQPTAGTPTRTDVRGLVQPKPQREMDDSRSAGTQIGDHTIFMRPMDLRASDAIEHGGERYEVVGIRYFAFGTAPHLEVDARRIGASDTEAS